MPQHKTRTQARLTDDPQNYVNYFDANPNSGGKKINIKTISLWKALLKYASV